MEPRAPSSSRPPAPSRGVSSTTRGIPVPGASITVVSSAAVQETASNEEGQFSFAGVAEGPVTLYVRCSGRRVRVPVKARRADLRIDLPAARLAAGELLIELRDAATDELLAPEKASLVAALVPGFIGEWPGVEIEDGVIRAVRVPAGDWTLYASVGIGQPVIEKLTLKAGSGDVVRLDAAVRGIGTVECLLELPDGASSNGGLIVASRAGLHGEPPFWFKIGDGVTRTEIVVPVSPSGSTTVDSVASGTWRFLAHGDGWASRALTVDVTAGGLARADFEACASGTVAVAIPDLVRPGRLEFDVRTGSAPDPDAWDTRARFECFRAADGPFDIALPVGEYEWRARLIGYSDSGENIDLFPRTQGKIVVEDGGSYRIDVEHIAQ